MEDERLRIQLRFVINNIQFECLKVEIDYPTAQISDLEKQGMIAAYTEASDTLAAIVDDKSLRLSLTELLDKWFGRLNSYKESSNTLFETGYVRALRNSMGYIVPLFDD